MPLFILTILSFVRATSWLLLLLVTATAQDNQAGLSVEVRAGFDGYYKPAHVVPLMVTTQNDGPPLEGEVRVVTGNRAFSDELSYSAPISLPTQSNKQSLLTVYLPRFTSELTAEVVDAEGAVAGVQVSNTLNQLAVDDLLYGVVGAGVGELAFLEDVTGGRSRAAVAFLTLAELPEIGVAWDALDVVIFDEVDTSRLTAGQQAALLAWLDGGGHLVVTGGPNWQAKTAGVPQLLPVTVSNTLSLEDVPALRELARIPFRDPAPYLIAESALREGELLLHEEGLPLLAVRQHGRGRVYFLALDPRLAPLLDWDGSVELWSLIAEAVPSPTAWEQGVQDGYAAATAVSTIPSLALPSIGQLLSFLLLYIVVIGPLNYLLLRRINRRELAWITIPALVLLFSAFTYFTSFRTRGNNVIVNEMAVVYGQAGAEQVHVQSILGLYSPRRGVFDVRLPGEAAARPFTLAFGSPAGGGNLQAVVRDSAVQLSGIRTDTSDMQTFLAESYQPAPAVRVHIQPVEGGTANDVEITVENLGEQPLEHALLLVGSNVHTIGTLAAGEGRVMAVTLPDEAGSSGGTSLFASSSLSTAPLLDDPAVTLGTTEFFTEPRAFARWQLLQALSGSESLSNAGNAWPQDGVTLVGWSEEGQLQVEASAGQVEQIGTTLYFLEIPRE